MDRATALTTPLPSIAAWHLLAHCAACRLTTQIGVGRLPGATLADVLPRLRCSRCRARPDGVWLENAAHGAAVNAEARVEVVLVP